MLERALGRAMFPCRPCLFHRLLALILTLTLTTLMNQIKYHKLHTLNPISFQALRPGRGVCKEARVAPRLFRLEGKWEWVVNDRVLTEVAALPL